MQFEPRQVHAPEIGLEWLNSPPLTMRGLLGRVVLVDFWDYTCVNCIHTLPYVRQWHCRYQRHGLVVIGVHAPEFSFAHTSANVAKAVEELQLGYPVLLDNDYQVWKAFANRYWPAKYLIDKDGYLRYFHAGEGNYEETERMIQTLVREIDPAADLPPLLAPVRALDRPDALEACDRPTPELYLGYQRGRIANPEGFNPDRIAAYQFGAQPPADAAELGGPWFAAAEFVAVAALPSDGEWSRVRLRYSAAEINLVMAPGTSPYPSRVEITDNGHPLDHQSRAEDVREQDDGATWIEIDRPRMYSLVKRDRFLSRELQLASRSTGLQLFAFTFVSCVPAAMTVVAAVIERKGLVLVCQRKRATWHALKWEFPGGKVEPGESPVAAIRRELEEELGIRAEIGPVIADYPYQYPERPPIRLIFYSVTEFAGEVENREFEQIRWEKRARLPQYDFLEGDVDFVRTLAARS